MRWFTWQLAVSSFAAVSLAGCASAPYVNQHIEAVNAEYRELEVYSYELERENKKLADDIQSLQDENIRLKGGTVPTRRSGPFSAPSSKPRTNTSPRPNLDPPAVDVPEITIPETPTLPPVVPAAPRPFPSGGGASTSRPSTAVSSQKPPEATLPLLPPAPKPPRPILEDPPPAPDSLNVPAGELPPPATKPEGLEPEPIDKKVTSLFFNPILTRGANFDSQPGADGLALVLEPRNAAGQFVPQSGPISIVVLDPTKAGDAARIARWTLEEPLIRQRISRNREGRGIHLQLPWSGGVPQTNQLKLFVRYEAADGRKIEAEHDVILNPEAQVSQRWTPRNGGTPRSVTTQTVGPEVQPTAPNPAAALTNANPPLPAPAVKSDLTKVIQEPPAPQTSVASKEPAEKPAAAPAPIPGLLAPPPPRPEWKPFR